jgi:hypothetical protein
VPRPGFHEREDQQLGTALFPFGFRHLVFHIWYSNILERRSSCQVIPRASLCR